MRSSDFLLQSLNGEIERRINVVGILPDEMPLSIWSAHCSLNKTTTGLLSAAGHEPGNDRAFER
jgi:hypothetical protein